MVSTRPSTGVLYLKGDGPRAQTWVARGSAPCYVVPLAGWSAVVPAGPAAAPAPYDAGPALLLARVVPSAMRSAVGFFQIDGRLIATVHPPGWRAVTRWLVWESGRGLARLPSLPAAQPADLVRAAGVTADVEQDLRDIFAERSSAVSDVLADVVGVLGLPGERLVLGRGVRSADGAVLVEPAARSVRQFQRITSERKEIHDTIAGTV